ncbi:hypothetical protein Tco_0214400 [Tanacetum coccineum]
MNQTLNSSVFKSFFEKEKLSGPNFIDWYHNLRIVLMAEDKLTFFEQPIHVTPVLAEGQVLPQQLLNNYNMHGMGKTINELHAMLKLHEETLPKKEVAPVLHVYLRLHYHYTPFRGKKSSSRPSVDTFKALYIQCRRGLLHFSLSTLGLTISASTHLKNLYISKKIPSQFYENEFNLKFIDAFDVEPIGDDSPKSLLQFYKTPTGCTPFRIVYGKACHLPVEIEHKAHWALKQCNMDLTLASKSRLMQLSELTELRDGAYENTRINKERTKKWHDSRLCGNKYFKVGDKVLLYNSRLKMYPRKLKSKWSGLNIVQTVYPYGAVEIIDKNRFNFKVNGQRLKKYYEGNIDKEDDEVIEFENGVTGGWGKSN